MGGKNKQRTKGNVRPSSSGRAAELLARENGVVPGFVGFGVSTSNDLGYVPAVHGAEEIDNLVDADFRLVLRKLSKRDAVTKLKAVQEFGTMCQERDSDIVKGVLPYWPRIYCKISMDHDRRVREATQQAFEQLILKVKRNLAPYLKGIMGHWLIAQCDSYSPAASAANVAFQAAFPLNKQPEALSFCKDEVLNVLQDNLLKETADTLSDPQSIPEEERQAKYMRVLTSSLLALKKLLMSLSISDREALSQRLAHIISQGKFWKYSKHKTPQVRGAFFKAVAALCELTPQLIQTEAARACSAVLLSIDDSDPVVLPPLWEAVLHVISSIQDCWTHVNAQKGVLPKLWALLREGGRGLATSLHPNMLPFISKLPGEVTEPKLDFCSTFFSSTIQGLSSERALVSPSECAAIVFATMECLRFLLLQNAGEEPEQRAIQNMLISEQLLPLIDKALRIRALQSGPLFPQITEMLVSWEKRAVGNEATTFLRLLADFWEGLGSLCVHYVDHEEQQVEQVVLQGIASLLQIMQNPGSDCTKQGKRKKTVKVCFSEEEVKGQVEENLSQTPEVEILQVQEKQDSPLTSSHLLELVCQLAELNMVYVSERDSERHLHFLALLLQAFPKAQVFQGLLKQDDGKTEVELEAELSENPAIRFLLQRVVVWLRQDERKDTDFLVDMVFSSLQCCSSNAEQTLVLNHITVDLKWGVILQIIQKACADAGHLEVCAGWLRGSVLGERMVRLAGELCAMGLKGSPSASSALDQHNHSWRLISLALSQQHNDDESLIGKVYVEQIIEQLHATLSEAKGMSDAGNMEPLVSFISDVAFNFFSSIKGCLLLAAAEDLLFTIFQLCAQDQMKTHLSDTLREKLKHAYTVGVHSLVTHLGAGVTKGTILHSAAVWAKNQLLTSPLNVKSLQVLVQAVQSLTDTLATAQMSDCLLSQFICCLTPTNEEWAKLRETLSPQWVKRPLLCGHFRAICVCPGTEAWKVRGFNTLPAHLCASALLGKIIFSAVPADEQQEETYTFELSDLGQTVAEILYALQWCEEMEHCPALVSEYHKMLQDWDIIQKVHTTSLDKVLETLFTRSREDGALWSLTLANYIQNSRSVANRIMSLYDNVESFYPLTEQNVSTMQVLCPYMTTTEREALIALSIAEFLNWQEREQDCAQSVWACLAVLDCCLQAATPVEDEILLAVMATMLEWRSSKEEWFLFNSDLGNAPASQLALPVEMMRFLSWLVNHSPTVLGNTHWDFLLCSMLAWLETASESSRAFWNPCVQQFVQANCELVVTLNEFFTAPPAGVMEQLPPDLSSEWQEFFMEGIHNLLLPLLIKIPVEFSEPDEVMFPVAVVEAVGEALRHIPVQLLTNNTLPARFVADQRSSLPDALQTLLNTLTPLLLFKSRPLQLAVYHMLHKVIPSLPESDSEGASTKSEDEDEEEPSLSPPAAIMSILIAAEELVENILGSVQVGEFAVVQPLSMEHCCILGYLLAWKLLLIFFKAAPSQLRVQYCLHLKKTRSLHKLLLHLFRLMPENPTLPGQLTETASRDLKSFFTESLSLSLHQKDGLQFEVPHLACSVYYSALKDLPAMVRLWWNSQEKRVVSTVDKFTSKYVSSVLSAQEIASVQSSTQTFDSMTVKARSATREVIATYSVDDIFIELVIQLPQNYPLGSIIVESGRRVGVAVQQWRNWMLQLSTYLTHQNGSIMEGLSLWKNNVDKRFEGVEDCMICFSVIHGSNYSLPKKACRTCKKKFHSACLYKWFTSSNKSTCPLCRETFF
ncbi:E3 ubiquitin-protein ligase listerin [Pangasianodon hypophthalmus]|uniref:E3 ubiquitin-protein ligase listerin n=1 Tax=Pangasianodon hypophthalmus TaxID=310915 RepID=UPI00230718C3|nr:E3 ubiquitin-protein ligase listerin [Pangasianodon hypophthalmus]